MADDVCGRGGFVRIMSGVGGHCGSLLTINEDGERYAPCGGVKFHDDGNWNDMVMATLYFLWNV